ncbi:hypothetical protein D9758_018967 [Tetrapyrgos nigripes]|uniref:Uncharacterized protein n=1 Tax=Tetrapyrgos nigripes TaxID=182062 RepID=A0A8H5ERI4_9AGAR|nr:hypothetical protein D9758_018967 [Tetrapyrgos nigripes]
MTNKTLLKIPMANLEELNALWNADPAKRLPTLLSRRRWAEARNLDVNKVHRWWRDQRSKAKRNHIWVSETESYDIPVGTPPILGPEDQLSVEAMDEDKPISVSVKKEPYTYSKSLFRPATAPVRLTRARARAARETASTSTHVDQSRSSPEPESSLPSSSPPSLFDQYSSHSAHLQRLLPPRKPQEHQVNAHIVAQVTRFLN